MKSSLASICVKLCMVSVLCVHIIFQIRKFLNEISKILRKSGNLWDRTTHKFSPRWLGHPRCVFLAPVNLKRFFQDINDREYPYLALLPPPMRLWECKGMPAPTNVSTLSICQFCNTFVWSFAQGSCSKNIKNISAGVTLRIFIYNCLIHFEVLAVRLSSFLQLEGAV